MDILQTLKTYSQTKHTAFFTLVCTHLDPSSVELRHCKLLVYEYSRLRVVGPVCLPRNITLGIIRLTHFLSRRTRPGVGCCTAAP